MGVITHVLLLLWKINLYPLTQSLIPPDKRSLPQPVALPWARQLQLNLRSVYIIGCRVGGAAATAAQTGISMNFH